MKIEKRGKYPGVKVHLDPDECQAFIQFGEDVQKISPSDPLASVALKPSKPTYFSVSAQIGKKMGKILVEEPDFLKERTPEQIKESLLADKAKIEKQLAAGGAWKNVE